jgi:hypothetical protein
MAIAKRLLPAATVRLVGRMSMEPAPARLTKGA